MRWPLWHLQRYYLNHWALKVKERFHQQCDIKKSANE